MRTQQSKLYAAEASVPTGRSFSSVTEIQAWVDGLRDTWWWQMWYPQVLRVEVTSRPARMNDSVGSWHPDMGAGQMEMMRVHWNQQVVVHELAHVLAAARYGSHSHDPYFARVYLELLALVGLTPMYAEMYEAFERAGIAHDVDDERLGQARRMPAPSA
jgi:putative metallohydrolase (TIGR04338 family)